MTMIRSDCSTSCPKLPRRSLGTHNTRDTWSWNQSRNSLIMRGINAHPLRATLLNIAFGMLNANLRDVAYFPKSVFPQRLSSAAKRHVKLHMLYLCLGFLLKDIKALSHSGVLGGLAHMRILYGNQLGRYRTRAWQQFAASHQKRLPTKKDRDERLLHDLAIWAKQMLQKFGDGLEI
ncbi:hypothetical protein CEUSTIGMA_g8435.t1 [Chlamydomonas eustigma]|uniref:Uncharacterized protein n=1 Tax=Chlamydomonas eustigma TaxID=1157962 RepID=A0A250XDZ6_9CHLO|nr:hypothetical protein CEUSTIGMA_g8435.t1 [Chlamydomonas eustigma]|eukprot:GAX81000.1 hypothetical protein CEUSTIGMA_g8435.t1 [Chlamydomonas eustigma]